MACAVELFETNIDVKKPTKVKVNFLQGSQIIKYYKYKTTKTLNSHGEYKILGNSGNIFLSFHFVLGIKKKLTSLRAYNVNAWNLKLTCINLCFTFECDIRVIKDNGTCGRDKKVHINLLHWKNIYPFEDRERRHAAARLLFFVTGASYILSVYNGSTFIFLKYFKVILVSKFRYTSSFFFSDTDALSFWSNAFCSSTGYRVCNLFLLYNSPSNLRKSYREPKDDIIHVLCRILCALLYNDRN